MIEILEVTEADSLFQQFQYSFRDSVLAAMDCSSDLHGLSHVTDDQLPRLFKTIDQISATLWLRHHYPSMAPYPEIEDIE